MGSYSDEVGRRKINPVTNRLVQPEIRDFLRLSKEKPDLDVFYLGVKFYCQFKDRV
jgi:hypothetical protein